MRSHVAAIVAVLVCVGSARAELKLFAKYDWQDGAKDTAGVAIRHDGAPATNDMIAAGKLTVQDWDGVWLGNLPELDGATEALFRFEDVTFTQFGSSPQASGNYPVLAGDEMKWWLAAHFNLLPESEAKTTLIFNLGGFGSPTELQVDVADAVISHFDSIEYRLDGSAPLSQRLAIRWNDGPWVFGGVAENDPQSIPATTDFQINNGAAADWDPMWATIGPVSFYSNIVVPEPGAATLALLAATLCLRRRRT